MQGPLHEYEEGAKVVPALDIENWDEVKIEGLPFCSRVRCDSLTGRFALQ